MIEHFQHAQSNREHCDGIYIRMRDLIANQNRRYREYGHGSKHVDKRRNRAGGSAAMTNMEFPILVN